MNQRQRNRTIIVLFTVVLATCYTSLGIVKADSLQITTSDTYLVAGQENQITINLKNIGDRSVVGIQSTLSSSTPGLSILEESQRAYTVLEGGKTKKYSPIIYVDKSLPLGSYTLTLMVTYQKITFEYVTSIVSVGVVVSEDYSHKLGLHINQDEISASAGTNNQVSYVFENVDEQGIVDVELTLSSTYPQITILGGEVTRIPSVEAGGEFTITPEVSVLQGTSLSTYSLSAILSYRDEAGDRYHQSFTLPLVVDSERPQASTIVTLKEIATMDTVYPGEDFQVNLMVECTGADAYDLMAVLGGDVTGNLSPLSPTTLMIGDISAGETLSFSYDLLAKGNIAAGQYPLSITLTYSNNKGNPVTLTETITVQVEGLIDFQLLDIPEVSAPLGEVTELEADLLLIGTQSVEFVSIETVEDSVVSRVSGSEEYIGAVDPDSPIPFDVKFRVDPDAEKGSHELGLKVTYRDHLNREHSEDISVTIDIIDPVPETDENNNQGILGWILSILGLRN